MNSRILILPPNHTEDDSAIWRAAIACGIKTLRCQKPSGYPAEVVGVPPNDLFYYGNTLHYRRVVEAGVPLRAQMLDPLWPNLVVEYFALFGRGIAAITHGEFSRRRSEEKFFVKCAGEKWFKPLICTPADVPTGSSKEDDVLHVQGVAKFSDEVRCWILNGEIITWSYYRKNGKPWRAGITDAPAQPEWDWVAKTAASYLPNAIVVDVGRLESSGTWHLIEANEPWASGIYDCDPDSCLTVIMRNQQHTRQKK